jgi:hypothetical protein
MKEYSWNWIRVLVVVLSLVAGIGSYLWRQQQDSIPPKTPAAVLAAQDVDDVSSYTAPIPEVSTDTSSATSTEGAQTGKPSATPAMTASSAATQPAAASPANEWEQHITPFADGTSPAAGPSVSSSVGPTASPPPDANSSTPDYSSSSPAYDSSTETSAAPSSAATAPSYSAASSDPGATSAGATSASSSPY